MLVLRPQAEVFIGILPLFLQVICSFAHSLSSYGQLLQTHGDTGSDKDSFDGQLLHSRNMDTRQKGLPGYCHEELLVWRQALL